MLDFEVKKCSRRCAATDAQLLPGDRYYSVLDVDGADVVRRDFSVAAWSGPPPHALGWWEARVPVNDNARPKLAPSEVALELFDRWADSNAMDDAVYVLSLFLIRKRLFRFAENVFETKNDSAEVLRLYCPTRAAEYEVAVVDVRPERASEIQNQLVELLYSDAA